MRRHDIDYLRGGLPIGADYSPTIAPADKEVGENHGVWIFDDLERFAFFVHLEASGRLWGVRREWVELIMADGAVYYGWQYGRLSNTQGPGAACAKTECVAPFVNWKLNYEGFLNTASGSVMARELLPDVAGELAAITLQADLSMCGPAWQQGTMHSDAKAAYGDSANDFMGGVRYEQLHEASGVLQINGKDIAFKGRGVRSHRLGRRDLARMVGHWWHTVTFASGRAFGCHRFTDPDKPSHANYNEAYVQDEDGRRYPAVIVSAPFSLDTPEHAGQVYDIVLESDLGRSVIRCETIALAHVSTIFNSAGQRRIAFGVDCSNAQHHVLNHGITRNVWDGEVAVGLLERSARVELLESEKT